ncbi:MAG: nitroreductase family protein [Hyphomicrobiales bacterium]
MTVTTDAASRARYDALMDVIRERGTSRAFDPDIPVPDEHFGLILEAARHAPSGANAQPWHFIVVSDREIKSRIADYFVSEQRFRAKAGMKFPTPDYRGIATAPGVIIVAADFRWVRAFPGFHDTDTDLARMYRENAERILLQSVAAATMSAHLAAAALGHKVWWITASGQEKAQTELKPLLDVPEELAVLDIMCFGQPLKPPYTRWKKDLGEITHRNRFDRSLFMTDEEIDEWIRTMRHKVMYKDAGNID